MLRRFCQLGLGCLFALTVVGADGNPPGTEPLSESKKALSDLRQDQAINRNAPDDANLRDYMPEIAKPVADPAASETWAPKKNTLKQNTKSMPSKNWLIDGMDKLDRKRELGAKDKSAAYSISDGSDEREQASLLDIYSHDAAEATERKLKVYDAAKVSIDPLVQSWLKPTNSDLPLLGSINTINAPGTVSSGAIKYDTVGTLAATSDQSDQFRSAGGRPDYKAPVNPYLSALDAPAGRQELKSSPTPVLAPVSSHPPVQASTIPATNSPAAPPPVEDKKYFPQLKKF